MRSGAKVGIVGGVFVVVAGGVLGGAYSMFSPDNGTSGKSSTDSAPRSGALKADEISQTGKAFLDAWSRGDTAAAAALTNNAADAQTALAAFKDEAHLTDVRITPAAASGATVGYTVSARVVFEGKTAPLSYTSRLTVVRGLTTRKPLVDWQPALLHPDLKKGERLATGVVKTPQIDAVDARGRLLTKEQYPSLTGVLDALRQRYGSQAGGTAGIELRIENSTSPTVPPRTLVVLEKGRPGRLVTTLDAQVQAAAEKAVKRFGQSSVVAIQPSTGEIKAVADNRTDSFPASLQGRVAPGSTMKIVTAAMLIDHQLAGADEPIECPKTVTWERAFHNLNDFEIPNATLATSFARSCNTAFIKQIAKLGDQADTALAETARKYFGINTTWNTGVQSVEGSVPPASGANSAAAFIGQGLVQMNPLSMASITATATDGHFRQPVIVPKELIGERQIATAEPLPPSLHTQLRSMMQLTATQGTAATAMAGVHGDKGAKTGSAERDGQGTSDSWFTGYHNDLAAAALVQSGGHGGDTAGPIVADLLTTS